MREAIQRRRRESYSKLAMNRIGAVSTQNRTKQEEKRNHESEDIRSKH